MDLSQLHSNYLITTRTLFLIFFFLPRKSISSISHLHASLSFLHYLSYLDPKY